MSLWDIKNKLYNKEEENDLSTHGENPYDPISASQPKTDEGGPVDLWAEKGQGLGQEERKAVRIGVWALFSILGVIVVLLGAFLLKQALYSDTKISVAITGPKDARSGKLLTYEIAYSNDNWLDLKNASIRLTYPENFKPEETANLKSEGPTAGIIPLGNISSHGSGKVVLNGRMYSPKGALIYLKADLVYSPSSLSVQFVSKSQIGISVSSSPIAVEVIAPQNVSTGDEVNYLVTYKNEGNETFENLRIRAEYPEGFSFASSEPSPFEANNIWYVGSMAPGQSGKIVIAGKLEGNRDQTKKVGISAGIVENGNFVSMSDEEAVTRIVSSPLSISQTVNGLGNLNVNAGQNLAFTINYRNNGSTGLRDVIVTEKLDSPALDYTTLNKEGGSYDERNKIITWKASDYPQLKNLKPGDGGEIRFMIRVKDVIPVNGSNDKNFVVSSLAKIDSPDIPTPISMNKIVSGNRMDMKLNSKLVLDVKGYYTDPNIPNSGPIPPKIGQETTYTIHWIARNVSNDISGTRVEAFLPTSATATGKFFPGDGKVVYNERSNSIVWDIGGMDAGTGILSSPKEVSFQVRITPSPEQFGQEIGLLNESTITAKDLFTGENLKSEVSRKTTNLPEDASLNFQFNAVN
jgi:uncharacterized repeat protein (TIGR01451 family)